MSTEKQLTLEDAQTIVRSLDNPSVWRAANERSAEERLAIGLVIIDYRMRGKTFETIERELGIPRATAVRYRDKAMETFPAPIVHAGRIEEANRLEQLAEAVWDKALTGDKDALASYIKLSERRAKLLGWDSPMQVEATHTEISKEEQELQQLIAQAERDNQVALSKDIDIV